MDVCRGVVYRLHNRSNYDTGLGQISSRPLSLCISVKGTAWQLLYSFRNDIFFQYSDIIGAKRQNATNLICDKPYKASNVVRDKPYNATNVISDKCNDLTKATNVISDNVAYNVCHL